VFLAVVGQTWFMGRAVLVLDVALLISLMLWVVRPITAPNSRVLPVFIGAAGAQIIHFAEEYRAGFQRVFPAQFGYVWENWRFVTFNALWLIVFGLSIAAIARGRHLGYLSAYFLALAGIGNGIGHLTLAARVGGYYPGAYTAPLSLIAGVWLAVRLMSQHGVLDDNHRSAV